MGSLSSIAFAVRASSKSSNIPVSLSHLQQLVAACFGHKSLAAYQASRDVKNFPLNESLHFVLDSELYSNRFTKLSVNGSAPMIESLIRKEIAKQLPAARLHANGFALDDYVREQVEHTVINDNDVSSEVAMTNTFGYDEIYLPVDDIDIQNMEVGKASVIEESGHVSMEVDTERPYSGHQIEVRFSVTLESISRVCILEPIVEVIEAKLKSAWGDDEENDIPRISLAEALARELGLELSEAEELEDAECIPDLNDDDFNRGYVFHFEDHASPALAEKLIRRFGGLEVKVPSWFFDDVRHRFD